MNPSNNFLTPLQKIYIDPYAGKLFDFDNVSSKVYLAQTINNLLRAYGNNFVIEGFRIKNANYKLDNISDTSSNLESHLIEFDITPGRAIVDNTYIEVIQTTRIVYDVTNLDDSGFLILSLEFNFLQTPFENNSIFKINFFDSAAQNNIIGINGFNNNSSFFTEIPRIVLLKLTFNKEQQKILKIINYTKKILLLNKEYEIYPISKLLKDFINILENRF